MLAAFQWSSIRFQGNAVCDVDHTKIFAAFSAALVHASWPSRRIRGALAHIGLIS